MKKAIDPGEPYSLELKAKTAKGNVLWVYTNGKPNYVNGKVVSLSGTIQDIDARKKAEILYEQERRKSTQNAKLASLGQLSAGVAHEINNPLAIIKGSVTLIPKFLNNPDKLNSKIDSIVKSCERISNITKSLQKFSRSSSGRNFKQRSLAKILIEALSLTKLQTNRLNVRIDKNITTDAEINCNDLEIEQVVINLINNAIFEIKNRDEKWIKVDLQEESDQLILSITDSGPGIPADLKEKLFDPFFTTKATGEGTGLGLSITKGILDEHGATITLDEKSANTRFVIAFPRISEG